MTIKDLTFGPAVHYSTAKWSKANHPCYIHHNHVNNTYTFIALTQEDAITIGYEISKEECEALMRLSDNEFKTLINDTSKLSAAKAVVKSTPSGRAPRN